MPKLYATNGARCPVMFYKIYEHHRPQSAKEPDSSFFLGIEWKAARCHPIWYTSRPMGKNKISEILTVARKRFGFAGRKVSNHSVRKTGIGRLLDADIPEVFVAQHAGIKNTESLKNYKSAGEKHQVAMSNVLNEVSSSTITKTASASRSLIGNASSAVASAETLVLSQSSTSSVSKDSRLFAGANFHDCTFNFHCKYGGSDADPSPPKRRFRLLSSSSEED